MTRPVAAIIIGATLLGCAPPAPLRVMSFNVRYANPADGDNRWENRSAHVAAVIRAYQPDVLAVQEALSGQAAELRAALPDYEFAGVGRDDGMERGEFVPIFYRQSRFTLVEKRYFWLSEHPDEIGSIGWDAALPRMATCVRLRFRDAPLYQVYVINVHLDHQGRRARRESAKLLRRIAEAEGSGPLIVLGDFNTSPGSEPYEVLTKAPLDPHSLRDAFTAAAAGERGDPGTFHAFTGRPREGRIDWILHNRRFESQAAGIDRTVFDGHCPSDHFPVTATLRMKPDGALD